MRTRPKLQYFNVGLFTAEFGCALQRFDVERFGGVEEGGAGAECFGAASGVFGNSGEHPSDELAA